MVIKIKSKTFKNNQYQSREESKTTILLDKALVEATKKGTKDNTNTTCNSEKDEVFGEDQLLLLYVCNPSYSM
jgi:hypothetical protein